MLTKLDTPPASRKLIVFIALWAMLLGLSVTPLYSQDSSEPDTDFPTVTPVKHVIVIFQENVSFDHYFATYPTAKNPAGQPAFHARSNTPTVNGLNTPALLFQNPNQHNPFRLARSQAVTCDQDHSYTDEQVAFDKGLMDKFVQIGTGSTSSSPCADFGFGKSLIMGYYDGNTVTGLWNYAQHYAMNDNSFNTVFGPSTPGALNLISGQAFGVDPNHIKGDPFTGGDVIGRTVIGDPDPFYDDCGSPAQVALTGRNVGDLLNAKGITWGWFQGGFKPTTTATRSTPAVCGPQSTNLTGTVTDYSAHHEPFQYYASTANPHHLPPSSASMIGRTDRANHQYDLTDFWAALDAGNFPAVSFLKAKKSQDGHAGYSDPLDEQIFLAETINRLQQSREWPEIAVVIAYDDSDGWYDHVMSPILSQSVTSADALSGPGHCGNFNSFDTPGRCGYGPRLPLLVVSPWSKSNFVDHAVTDQSSILRFIEDNFGLGRIGGTSFDSKAGSLLGMFDFSAQHSGKLLLNPQTGEPQ